MGDFISTDGWDLPALAARWARAQPFPHLALDGLVGPPAYAELRAAAKEEPLALQADEIYQHRASAEPPANPLLCAFADELASPRIRGAVEAITGVASAHVSLRAYRYDRGDYLLPHTDWRSGGERVLAFAYYLGPMRGERQQGEQRLRGGELELYQCALEDQVIVQTRSAALLEPRPNRLVLFQVGLTTLHRVREVLGGARLSLAGWFLA